jgi:outer membrane PBP1 activator LpoA protein
METAQQLLAKIKQWQATLPQHPSGELFSAERKLQQQ